MPFTLTTESVRRTLRKLLRGAGEAAEAEAAAQRELRAALSAAQTAFEHRRAEIQKQWDDEQAAVAQAYHERRAALAGELDAADAAFQSEFAAASADVARSYDRDEKASAKEAQEAQWTLEAIYDAQKKQAREHLDTAKRQFAEQRKEIQATRAEVVAVLDAWRQIPPGAPEGAAAPAARDPAAAVSDRLATARSELRRLRKLVAPRLLIGDRLLLIGLLTWLICAAAVALVVWLMRGAEVITILGGALLGGSLLAGAITGLLRVVLTRQAARGIQSTCEPIYRALAEAEALARTGEEADEARYKETVEREKQKFRAEAKAAEKTHRENLARALARRDEAGRRVVETRDTRKAAVSRRRETELVVLDDEHQRRARGLADGYGGALAATAADLAKVQAQAHEQFNAAIEAAARAWNPVDAEVKAELAAIAKQDAHYFPNWQAPAWSAWQPPATVPPSLRFGSFTAPVPDRPRDPRLDTPPERVTLPALLPFPHRCATLLSAAGDGRGPAVAALQAMAVRFLTSLPAGKVRLTIIDPVGLGENFASLMHLADHDPQLVGGRIWTEPAQIEKRLADVTAHMENVIQKYLRSQYASIEEYNTQAGEVAEPYRVVIVANFPANFTAEAARRLERIASSGANCGVYTLVSHDAGLPMPQDVNLAELSRVSLNLKWQAGRFIWQDPDFAEYPLEVDAPPAGDVLVKTLNRLGAAAKDANRVEVDFSFIAPQAEQIWAADSRAGIDVPLGRAGATKRQHLKLGHGTAQHVLVAGKTGSGKSTLLHALITNLALHYGPEEIELYLIDFKKGVEFTTYARHGLPHARVIAIESEREFGLSVLQRLDAELKRRGELYRQASAQDVKGYREHVDTSPNGLPTKLPRILLVVDEFQEFFVEDDRVAQEAALLLDRLVRQGRAFGLHVLLGSQTLGGAYSLARSTIDQMAVRIALQCSEADAGLILSKDNNAARLLSRPGEAIYNDANGLLEGNDIFQVCWLNDDRREHYLEDVAGRANRAGYRPPAPPVVFEGNRPSDLATNPGLSNLLNGQAPAAPPRELTCWLGDAMAIKEPTAAVFRRQSANNLLILGQQPDGARALCLAAAVATVVQQPVSDEFPRVLLIDATPADDSHAGHFAEVFDGWPGVRVYSPRDVAEALRDLAAESDRRQSEAGPPTLLIVYGLHRLRDLRKADDDLGFGRREGGPSPATQFSNLLRDGPAVGLHSMVWCDTLVNVQRAVERSTLREFEMKVLFQMGANDSSSLIDSPAASRLGVNRALFAHEELSAPEKFRPFNLPDEHWLRRVRERIAAVPV
jgi:energy-coupling factor transporter ATP-binding protein EcfA2